MTKKIFLTSLFLILPFISQAYEKPEVFVQLGHEGPVPGVAFSPDSKCLLSGSGDSTLKLWDVSTGREIRTFKGHASKVLSVAFSPDGRCALSCSWDHSIRLWDVTTGKEIRKMLQSYSEDDGVAFSLAFSPDARCALSGGRDKAVKLWNISKGTTIRTFKGHTDSVSSVAFSPDGRYAFSGDGKTVRQWDISSGKVYRIHNGLGKVALSPDGKYFISNTPENALKLIDVTTGREIKTIGGKSGSKRINFVAFSPDGQYAFSSDKDELRRWDLATGRLLNTYKSLETVAISPNGRYAVICTNSPFCIFCKPTMKLLDIQTGREVRCFKGYTDKVQSVAISPAGRYAVSGSRLEPLKLWDLSTGRQVRTFGKESRGANSIACSPESGHILTGGHYNTLRLWDIATGKLIRTLKGHSSGVEDVALSSDGRYALSGSDDTTIKLWDVLKGQEIRTFRGHSKGEYGAGVNAVAFSPDERYVLSGGDDNTVRLWDRATGKEIRTLKDSFAVESVAFSPDGRYALSGGSDVKLWDISTGQMLKKLDHEGVVYGVAFSPDGRYAISGSGQATIMLWDIATGKKIRTLTGHLNVVTSLMFSHDSRYALSGSWDGTVRFWDTATGKGLATMVGFSDGEWVTITPEGYYNSSVTGDRHLNVRVENNVYGIDQYRSMFYKPKVVEAAFHLGDTKKAVLEVLGKEKERPTIATLQNIEPPFIVIKSPEDGQHVNSRNTKLSVYIEDRNRPIKKLKVYVNGRPVAGRGDRGVKVVAKSGGVGFDSKGIMVPEGRRLLDLKIPLLLEEGENLIEVLAFNGYSEGRKSIRIYSLYKKLDEKDKTILPNLWILSIGVNSYQDKNISPLSYAVEDAHGIVDAFRGQRGKLFRKVNSLILSDKSSIKPTAENIIENLEYLGQAGHRDVILLFIAGHGINDDRGDFYFLPNDATFTPEGRIKKYKAVLWSMFIQTLDLPAKKLIFVDACHSEGVGGKRTKTRAVDNDRFVKELQDANAVIFTSSRGNELSQENDKWSHGAFTYALIEGLKGKADLIKDGKISMKELDAYVSETVPQLTHGAQHPITNTPEGYVNFPVALVK